MRNGMNATTRTEEIEAQLHELQLWFARKPYGWRERATPAQLQQRADREREQDRLIDLLEALRG